jgi:hypothetical protein
MSVGCPPLSMANQNALLPSRCLRIKIASSSETLLTACVPVKSSTFIRAQHPLPSCRRVTATIVACANQHYRLKCRRNASQHPIINYLLTTYLNPCHPCSSAANLSFCLVSKIPSFVIRICLVLRASNFVLLPSPPFRENFAKSRPVFRADCNGIFGGASHDPSLN